MKNKDKIIELVTSLINLTKQKKLEWNVVTEYLEENRNEILRYFIINNNSYYYRTKEPYLREYYSYCAPFKSGVVYIFSYLDYSDGTEFYILCVQSKKASKIIKLNSSDTYQENIRTLMAYIRNQFDNIDSFVDDIISEGKLIEQ